VQAATLMDDARIDAVTDWLHATEADRRFVLDRSETVAFAGRAAYLWLCCTAPFLGASHFDQGAPK
jgi:hypothetical protein